LIANQEAALKKANVDGSFLPLRYFWVPCAFETSFICRQCFILQCIDAVGLVTWMATGL